MMRNPFTIPPFRRVRLLPALAVMASVATSARAGDLPNFEKDIQPLLKSSCIDCHNDKKKKGGVDFSVFATEAAAANGRKTWLKAIDQVKAGDMPPEGEDPLTAGQKAMLLKWMEHAATYVDLDPARQDPGPAPIRRLNRSEYDNTIQDLTGVDFNSARQVGMGDDTPTEGYATLANHLTLPAALLDKYFAAADKIVDAIFYDAASLPPSTDATTLKNRKAATDRAARLRKPLLIAAPADKLSKRDAAKRVIARFASRAYRRPVRPGELDRLLTLFDFADGKGESFEQALRLPFKGVLVSPNFLYRVEQDRGKTAGEIYRISDQELAVRLSYFLWSTMPDDGLLQLADAGKLSDPAVLEQQVRRMIKDKRAQELTRNFAARWLQLASLDRARPSTEFFPTFTPELRRVMKEEPRLMFDHLRLEDRSILDFLDADYTFVNELLARHYGLEGVKGNALRRVQLKPEDHRGGLLGMAAVLAMTSHTSRTSPTLRGKYVLEVIFGTPPPPPPPDAGELKPDKKGKAAPRTFREQMAAHANDASCASCHKRIDPMGYGLEDFNAVGQWRADAGGGRALDNFGKLPTGEEFRGYAGLKKIIADRKPQFVRNVVEQMMTYALGRELAPTDEAAIQTAVASLAKHDHKFASLVMAVVQSKPFLYRRNAETSGIQG
jgi:hypothetical protein